MVTTGLGVGCSSRTVTGPGLGADADRTLPSQQRQFSVYELKPAAQHTLTQGAPRVQERA